MIRDFKNADKEDLSTEEILALLLSFSLKKCDYRKETAYLLRRFGSFENLLNSRAEYLMTDPQIRLNTALMLKGIPAMVKESHLQKLPKHRKIKTPQAAITYLEPYFIGYNFEQAYLLLLSDFDYPKEVIMLGEGSGNHVYIDNDRILRELLLRRCNKAILAHSHPQGKPEPSMEDKLATAAIAKMFSPLNLQLMDHLIFTKNDCICLSEDEEMDRSVLAFSKNEPGSVFD